MLKVSKESNREQIHWVHKNKQILLRIVEKKDISKSEYVTTIQILLIVSEKIIKGSNYGREST